MLIEQNASPHYVLTSRRDMPVTQFVFSLAS